MNNADNYKLKKLKEVCNCNDIMGINGDGMNYKALLEAGVEDADILISVTGSDEQNLLCSLFAKKESKCSLFYLNISITLLSLISKNWAYSFILMKSNNYQHNQNSRHNVF